MALVNDPVKAAEEQKRSVMMPYNPIMSITNSGQTLRAMPTQSTNGENDIISAPPGLDLQTQKSIKANMFKGGVVKNKKIALAEGGMLQEGGTVDPISGNEVPTGSLQEEVRDDIPAQLSEGEFVFPADVVRYIGLEKLMQLRQAAKEGLAKMEAMGQMGNSEEATMEDTGAFESEIDSILKEVESEKEGI